MGCSLCLEKEPTSFSPPPPGESGEEENCALFLRTWRRHFYGVEAVDENNSDFRYES